MRSCPSREELRRLLAEELTGPELAAIQKHVDGCPGCQESLETLTGPAAELFPLPVSGRAPSEAKDRSPRDPALAPRQDFLDRLMAQGPSADTHEPLVADAASRSKADTAWPTVPGYEILGVLGQGGMGLVYRARDVRLNRPVALKMIAVQAKPEQRARFHREAEAAARLQHPHIVQVYEVGEHEGRPYLILELVEGGSLAEKLQGTPQPTRPAAELVLTLARAMHYAHQQGIIHRDLKPANILLASVVRSPSSVAKEPAPSATNYGLRTTDYGLVPKIADFGLAKQLDLNQDQTRSGMILGTPSYMAPEQAAGSAREIGPAADIYALGVILYELLTGRPPFRADTPLETLQQVVSEEPVSPSRLRPKLPRDLQTICLKCLEKEPNKRYGSAAALAEDLQRFLADEPIQARRTSLLERAWRLCRRNPALAVLTVSVAALLVLLAIGSTTAALWLNRAARQQTEKLCQSLLAQARTGRLSRRVGQRFESLQAVADAVKIARKLNLPEDRFVELRNEAIACLALPDLRVAREWEGCPAGTVAAHCDGLLERYARLDDHGTVSIRRLADDQEIYRLTDQDGTTWLLPSPDGQFLVLAKDHLLKLWKLAGPQPSLILEVPDGGPHSLSPDCRQVAFGRKDGFVDLYDLASSRRIRRLPVGAEPVDLAYHPTGRQLAIALSDRVQVLDDVGNKLVEFPLAECSRVAWHPDGKVLAAVGEGNIIYLWDVVSRKQTAKLEGSRNSGIRIAFNHAGDLLASAGWEGMLRLWDPRTGKQLFHTPAAMWDLHFSPDDRFLATEVIANKLRIWHVDAGREYRTPARIPVRGVLHTRSTVSPDGRLLAVGTVNSGFGLWDLASGKELLFHQMPGFTHVLFEPSGALLAQGWNRLWRWPVQGEGATLRIGPPQPVPLPGSACMVAGSGDSGVIASPQHWGALVLHANRPQRPVVLAPHSDVRQAAVSPDGRWVVTASHGASSEVKVWESETGKLAKALFAGGGGHQAAFSPDGQWLAATGDGVRVWEVGFWREAWRLEARAVHSVAFSPDSKMLAFETGDGVVRLVNPERGREWARLIDPDQERADAITFTPDGTQLLATTTDGPAVHAWDLRAIRVRLAAMGLDWDLPPYPKEQSPSSNLPVREVKLDLGKVIDLFPGDDEALVGLNSFLLALNPFNWEAYWRRGRLFALRGEGAKAIADYTMALALLPLQDSRRAEILFRRASNYYWHLHDNARTLADLEQLLKLDLGEFCGMHAELARMCNDMARRLVAGPEKERAPARALPLAEKAVALTPGLSLYLDTLALVYYRLGKYRQVAELLERSWRDSDATPACSLFLLAMSYHRLNEPAKAQDCYEQAKQWWRQQSNLTAEQVEELKTFQAEAEAVLKEAKP